MRLAVIDRWPTRSSRRSIRSSRSIPPRISARLPRSMVASACSESPSRSAIRRRVPPNSTTLSTSSAASHSIMAMPAYLANRPNRVTAPQVSHVPGPLHPRSVSPASVLDQCAQAVDRVVPLRRDLVEIAPGIGEAAGLHLPDPLATVALAPDQADLG